MRERKNNTIDVLLQELNKYKRGIREYLLKLFERSSNISSDLEYLINYLQFDDINPEDLNKVSADEAKNWIIESLIGKHRGWKNDVMDETKANYFWNPFINLFDNPSVFFSNQIYDDMNKKLDDAWITLYDCDKFIYSNGILVFDKNQFGIFCIQESD